MERTLIGELGQHKGANVTICGWVDVARDQGKMAFFDFRDRSGKVQGIVFGKPEVLETAKTLRPEFVVAITGTVNERPEKMRKEGVQNGDIELEITDIEVLSEAESLPFDMDADLNLETLLDYRPLTLRRERERAIFKVQHHIVQGYRKGLLAESFTEFEAPKIVGGDAEGGANVFKLEYFKDQGAFLATSPQLYKQIMVSVFERVFAIGNVFRAEKHATTRHLNEYTSLDAEMGFIADHHDVMATLTRTIRAIIADLHEYCTEEFKLLGAEIPSIPESVPYMKLRETQALIFEKTGEDCREEKDLEPAHERWLSDYAREELGSEFIFITHYPITKTAFYAYEDPEDLGYAKYFDLLFRGIEIVSGGQRVHDYNTLTERIKEKGLDPENFSFYLSAFKYGMPPHGGWGMGLERLTAKFLNVASVKEATLFPRDMNRIDTLLSHEESPNPDTD